MGKTYEPGVYPQNWENMPLEGKIWHLYAKWDSIRDDDMYELRMDATQDLCAKRINAGFYFAANAEHQFTDNGAVLVPADKKNSRWMHCRSSSGISSRKEMIQPS